MACEYSPAVLHLWGGNWKKEIAFFRERLVVRLWYEGQLSYLYPVGSGSLEDVLRAMILDAADQGGTFRMICVPGKFRESLEQVAPGWFSFEEDRDSFDYVYGVHKLSELTGKKLHGKRNHINRFEEKQPNWRFEPLDFTNLSECLELDEAWVSSRINCADERQKKQMAHESNALREAVRHYAALGLDGGILRVDDRTVAFAMGCRVGENCFDVHFEKALEEIQGAYAVINRETARYICSRYPDIKWINREDDMGIEGLRQAKMSYVPDILLTKYTAKLIT